MLEIRIRVNAPESFAQGIKEDLAMYLERYRDSQVVAVDVLPEQNMEQIRMGSGGSACRVCGAPLKWIRTRKGKNMPCNAQPMPFWASDAGKTSVMTEAGDMVRCNLQGEPGKESGAGYRPHFQDCTGWTGGKKDG